MSQNLNPQNPHAELELDALARRGTDNQRARYRDGLLPEEELLAIARAEIFAPLNDFAPFRKMKPADAKHADRRCHGWVDFETVPAGTVDHDTYEEMAKIKAAADVIASHPWIKDKSRVLVEPSVHTATCKDCKHVTKRFSVRVLVTWANRIVSREYRIP